MLRAGTHKVLGGGRSGALQSQVRLARVQIRRRAGADVNRWATSMRNAVACMLSVTLVASCQTPGAITPDDMWCGTPDGKSHEWRLQIKQIPVPKEPTYYFRSGDYTILLTQEAVKAKYSTFLPDVDDAIKLPELRAVVKEVLAAPKLIAYEDLFSHVLPDGDLWGPINHLVVELVLEGQAAVLDSGYGPVAGLVAVRSKGPGHSDTSIHLGGTNGEQLLWRSECIAD
jgi:hypothetical protein